MTKLDIANSALVHLGASTISSLTENTPNAQVCNLRIDWCKRVILRGHLWNFAMQRTTLPSVADETPPYEYGYAHNLPVLCLRVVEVNVADYRIEKRQILANENGIQLRYIEDTEDFTNADVLMIESMSLYMAYDIALKITQSSETKQRMFEIWTQMNRKAKTVDSQEQPAGQVQADTYTGARRGTMPDSRIPLRDYPEYPL